jgi:hypothetical protein
LAKKGLIVVVLFSLLGVFGVAGGYLSSEWDSEWGLGAQLLDAIKIGMSWPMLVIEQIIGT